MGYIKLGGRKKRIFQKNFRRLKKILDDIDKSDYILLNDKAPTHVSINTPLKQIDLSFASAYIAPEIHWEVLGHLYGRDHFKHTSPAFISKPTFKLQTADCDLFKEPAFKQLAASEINNRKWPLLHPTKLHLFPQTHSSLVEQKQKRINATRVTHFSHSIPDCLQFIS